MTFVVALIASCAAWLVAQGLNLTIDVVRRVLWKREP